MDDLDDGEFFSLQAYGIFARKYEYVHLGIPHSKFGTDGINLSIPVLKLMENFTIQDKVIAYTSYGGYNLKTCQDTLDVKVINAAIYCTQKTMFQ